MNLKEGTKWLSSRAFRKFTTLPESSQIILRPTGLHDINYSPIKTSNPIEIAAETSLSLPPSLEKQNEQEKEKSPMKISKRTISTFTLRSFVPEIELTRAIRTVDNPEDGTTTRWQRGGSVIKNRRIVASIRGRNSWPKRQSIVRVRNRQRTILVVAWLLNGKFIDPRVPRRCVSY